MSVLLINAQLFRKILNSTQSHRFSMIREQDGTNNMEFLLKKNEHLTPRNCHAKSATKTVIKTTSLIISQGSLFTIAAAS